MDLNICKKCKNKFDLHVGDRIAFCHNKIFHSHGHLAIRATNMGLFVNSDEYKDTKFSIINPNGASRSDYTKAAKLGIKVLTPEEFEKKLKRVCRGLIPVTARIPFKETLSANKLVFGLDLTKAQIDNLDDKLKKFGCKITNQRRKSLVAVACNQKDLNSYKADLFRSWGIPVYVYGRIINSL